ncbi:MAG: type III pantothenate kinase [Bacteroidota bacterium]
MEPTRYVFDVGNSRTKVGKFQGRRLLEVFDLADPVAMTSRLAAGIPAIISSVRTIDELATIAALPQVMQLNFETPVPISLDYLTKETLGKDRIAGAVGAVTEFPGENCVIIDAGTCVNYDFVDASGVFRGGAISPGWNMRLHAMHVGTAGLPDISQYYDQITSRFPGKSTAECLRQGVELGISYEVQGFIDQLKEEHEGLRVILTGGDGQRFESFVKGPIFARPEIVLIGLNRILEYNEVV